MNLILVLSVVSRIVFVFQIELTLQNKSREKLDGFGYKPRKIDFNNKVCMFICEIESKDRFYMFSGYHIYLFVCLIAVAERLRHRSCDQNVTSSIPHSGISVEVTSQC